ncbi:helix-turn-helix transcriptional regulator [Thauera butanivorans]|uniref:helix-turn-helix transcriptional regulator n=1 Tax=Thauera butanivorans TaxID=86174 RepID=UPI000ADA5CE7|nr:AlpA family phage regulatory protein [Thauera butanivorans]
MPNIRTRVDAMAATPVAPPATPAAPVLTRTLPETGFLRQPQVLAFVPISKSTLWRRIQARTFPAPVKLSERVTVWRVEDIRRWIAQQGQSN